MQPLEMSFKRTDVVVVVFGCPLVFKGGKEWIDVPVKRQGCFGCKLGSLRGRIDLCSG
jgi:hypothetical protein